LPRWGWCDVRTFESGNQEDRNYKEEKEEARKARIEATNQRP
jgi:hypothetical protein